jgi:hypothetical protein
MRKYHKRYKLIYKSLQYGNEFVDTSPKFRTEKDARKYARKHFRNPNDIGIVEVKI